MKIKKKRTLRTSKSPEPGRYPVPGPIGGKLIRTLVASLRSAGLSLPVTSHILCACSGGADSVALAILLTKYGRRIGGLGQITLLHVNHGWRGAESNKDERFVVALAKKLKVDSRVHRLQEKPGKGDSWEAHARSLRKKIFVEEAGDAGVVLTAHQADDQAETRLWRLFTGAFNTLGEGILPRHGVEIRPLLGVRRSQLTQFLREECQTWREDSSNADPRFLRARMRKELMPIIEELFPAAIEAINSTSSITATKT